MGIHGILLDGVDGHDRIYCQPVDDSTVGSKGVWKSGGFRPVYEDVHDALWDVYWDRP